MLARCSHKMAAAKDHSYQSAFDNSDKKPEETSSLHEPLKLSDVRIVLMGKTGVGKSSTGNTILGNRIFQVSSSAKSVTEACAKTKGEVDGINVTVVDTPGLFDTDLEETVLMNRLVECIALSCPGPHIFVLVLTIGRFTIAEKKTVERLQWIFGEEACKYTIILFTFGDMLKQQTIEEYLAEAGEDLKQVMKKCGERYHVFNNELEDRTQVTGLMTKINRMVSENDGDCYTNEMYEKVEHAIQEREKELRNEMEVLVQKKQEEMDHMSHEYEIKIKELRERAVKDVQKKKFHTFKKVREQCKQCNQQ